MEEGDGSPGRTHEIGVAAFMVARFRMRDLWPWNRDLFLLIDQTRLKTEEIEAS